MSILEALQEYLADANDFEFVESIDQNIILVKDKKDPQKIYV